MNEPVPTLEAARLAPGHSSSVPRLTHLQQLEAESIHIIREAVAESDNPVLLYSIGKDSSVLLHLALKAFYPGKPPFPLLHVDTTWKFREMIAFRDSRAQERTARSPSAQAV
jgi:sulfate adenylyltransferase subunit 2